MAKIIYPVVLITVQYSTVRYSTKDVRQNIYYDNAAGSVGMTRTETISSSE